MPWTHESRRAAFSSIGRALLLLAIPIAAYAAEQTVTAPDFTSGRWWILLLFVQAITLLGYAASSLASWAGWVDGTLQNRLTILQGLACSIMAGNVAFALSMYQALQSEVISMMAAGAGGYGGDRFLTPLLQRVFGRATEEKKP